MAEFQELIKNFDRIRDYMRQFYVYGFKARTEFDEKSGRTYDNERRRVESWLADYVKSDYTAAGKHVYISVDSRTIAQNPLYAAWKSKSFTDNDVMLHYYILDLLWDLPDGDGKNAGTLGDQISACYGMAFDSQTIRLKLKEYEELGILQSFRDGKCLLYRLAPPAPIQNDLWNKLVTSVSFFQEAAPFGVVGSTILDREQTENKWFRFKHHYIVHTLEDGVLADLMEAMEQKRHITFVNQSRRSGKATVMAGIPLKIFVSTRTGRRYLCLYLTDNRRFLNVRLDCMTDVTIDAPCIDYEKKKEQLEKNLGSCFGVSFGERSRMETICMKLYIEEEKEGHILNRLYREGRGGEVQKIREHEYLYSGSFFDTNEMLSWIKTFTGRILDLQGSNKLAIAKITYDLETMYRMYRINGEEEHGTV